MIRKTAPLAAIVGLVCVTLLLLQLIAPGQAQPPGSTSPLAESPLAPATPVAADEAPAPAAGMAPGGVSTGVPAAASQPGAPVRRVVTSGNIPPAVVVVPEAPAAPAQPGLSPYPPVTPMGPQPSIGSATGTMAPGAARLPLPVFHSSGTAGAGGPTVHVITSGPATSGMMGPGGAAMGGMMMGGAMGPMVPYPSGPQPEQKLAEEAQRLRQADTPEEKQQAKETLEKLLGEYFDSDMSFRQGELDKVKQRVAKLEELLNKRKTAKQEIVDLQLRTMVNESEGLGFFSAPAPGEPGMPGIDPFGRLQSAPGMGMPGMGEMPGMGIQ